MAQVEIRVRPVIRYNVTRFYHEVMPNGMAQGGCESLGEFTSEQAAERVADAMRKLEQPLQYILVQETPGLDTPQVTYAYSFEEAQEKQRQLLAEGLGMRIWQRPMSELQKAAFGH
jgi:hypothetical protein